MRADMPWFLLIEVVTMLGALIYFIFYYVVELVFYRNRNWDFSVENPRRVKINYGSLWNVSPMPNQIRIGIGYPLTILVIGMFLLTSAYSIYRIQSCAYSDLKQCGIEVSATRIKIR